MRLVSWLPNSGVEPRLWSGGVRQKGSTHSMVRFWIPIRQKQKVEQYEKRTMLWVDPCFE